MPVHPDGCRDVWALPEAASLAQLPSDANPEAPNVWDALADARPALMADAHRPDLPDVDVGKSAAPEPDAPELDG